jgi:hypothetical protein
MPLTSLMMTPSRVTFAAFHRSVCITNIMGESLMKWMRSSCSTEILQQRKHELCCMEIDANVIYVKCEMMV